MTEPAPRLSPARLKKRYAAEARFKLYGRLAIFVALAFLVVLLGRIGLQGYSTFTTHSVSLPVYLDPQRIDVADLEGANYDYLVALSLLKKVGATEDEYGTNSGLAMDLVSRDLGFQILNQIKADRSLIGKTITVSGPVKANADLYFKGELKRSTDEDDRMLDNQQLDWLDKLKRDGAVTGGFNSAFFTNGDSTEPEQAGLAGAIIGSALMLLVTALIAVPSIIYGLLGLAVFINGFGMPRGAPITGGVVLALMALPTIIIATRSALKAVPPSIREAALGIGASKTQTVFHHVLPQAMAGMMTGVILSLAHALGETAPLLMIGMVAFNPGIPESLTGSAGVLPVQVFIWETASERAFHERTAAAIIVLLAFMIIMNAAAIVLRSRFERRW